jgi:hypothetical protein
VRRGRLLKGETAPPPGIPMFLGAVDLGKCALWVNRTSVVELKSCRHPLFGAKIEKGYSEETHFSTVSLK